MFLAIDGCKKKQKEKRKKRVTKKRKEIGAVDGV